MQHRANRKNSLRQIDKTELHLLPGSPGLCIALIAAFLIFARAADVLITAFLNSRKKLQRSVGTELFCIYILFLWPKCIIASLIAQIRNQKTMKSLKAFDLYRDSIYNRK